MYYIVIRKNVVKQIGVFILNLTSKTEIWNDIRSFIKGLFIPNYLIWIFPSHITFFVSQ